MATGPLRFRTPHIEDLPTVQTKQAPGFAWVAVSSAAAPAPDDDLTKKWSTTNRKRARGAGGAGESHPREAAHSARQQRETERRIRDLNADGVGSNNAAAVPIPAARKKDAKNTPAAARTGKTTTTKKILASGKTFAHYLDDDEAEMARNGGRRDADADLATPLPAPGQQQGASGAKGRDPLEKESNLQRASKTPIARRKPPALPHPDEGSGSSGSNHPGAGQAELDGRAAEIDSHMHMGEDVVDEESDDGDNDDPLPPFPSRAEMDALLNAPPLSYNQARVAPPPGDAPPPRRFCEICGYWGRVRCMKCGNWTCSVLCKDAHDEHKCLKFYA